MARKSVIVWTVLILLSGSLASVMPASAQVGSDQEFTQVGATALRFEHFARGDAIDPINWVAPIKGGPEPIFSGIGGPFDRDEDDDAGSIERDPSVALTDSEVIASWNPRNDTLYWTLRNDVCHKFWNETYEMDDNQPELYMYPDEKDLVVRNKTLVPVPFRDVFLEARDVEMENQLTLVSGWDPVRDEGDGVYLYYYDYSTEDNKGDERACHEGVYYGNWRGGGQVVDGDVAWMELNEDYGLVSVTGDRGGSTVLVHQGSYKGWTEGGQSASAGGMMNYGYRDNIAQNTLVGGTHVGPWIEGGGGIIAQPSQGSGGLWSLSASAIEGAPCSGEPPLVSAEYADLVEDYDGPLGTVTARWGTVQGEDDDVPILMVQDTTYKESAADPLTGKIDIYWYKTETNQALAVDPSLGVVAQQWSLLDTIRPTAPEFFYKSSHRTGIGYDSFENGLAVLQHYMDNGTTRADVAFYQFNSQCDPDADPRWNADPERPGYFTLIRAGQHLHTEEFTPHHIIEASEDGSGQLALWSPQYNALVFDKEPYLHESVERDGALSFYTFLLDQDHQKVHPYMTDAEETAKPFHFIPCPIVRKELPQGHLFWSSLINFDPGDRSVMAYAEMDYEWDNNNTFLPQRFTTDQESFYWFNERGKEGCDPPALDIPCYYDVSYDSELDQEKLSAGDEDCKPQEECEAGLGAEDCRPRRRAGGGGGAGPDDDGPTGEPTGPTPNDEPPEEKVYTFDRDTDGDGIPDVDDACPYDATKPGRDADGTIIESSVQCSDGGQIDNESPRDPDDGIGLTPAGVESNSPGMALWLALLIGAALVTLLIIVARRRNDDEEER